MPPRKPKCHSGKLSLLEQLSYEDRWKEMCLFRWETRKSQGDIGGLLHGFDSFELTGNYTLKSGNGKASVKNRLKTITA